ncbi:terpene cyclase [Pleurotus pulmonarius]|nr:terpene cyclase [Pleurotus pulmonarius]
MSTATANATTPAASTPCLKETTLDQVRQCVNRLITECNIPYVVKPFDQAFHEECCAEAARRGCPMEDAPGIRSISPKLVSGVGMAVYTFGHLHDRPTQIYIALYTGLLMYVEDYMQHDVENVSTFNQKYIRGDPQGHPVLDALAALLHELPQRFEPIVANIILTSALNYITAVWLEHQTETMELSPHATSFAGSRDGSPAIPDMMTFLNYSNDMLSFYKEELAGETANHVSIVARCEGKTKEEVLQRITEDTIACHLRLRKILMNHQEASEILDQLFEGYRIPEKTLDHVRQCVNRFLTECKIPYIVKPFDQEFHEECCAEAARRGCPMEDAPGIRSISPKLVSGVGMAVYTFGHLHDRPTQIYIALYTGLLMYVEDYMQHDVENVSTFNQKYIRGEPQGHPVLDALAALLDELPQRFEPIVANIILTSALNYITAVWLEHQTETLELSPHATSFAGFSRWISGSSEAFVLFVFASRLPLLVYIQAIPDMMTFLNYSNDMLSFYKEELAGETANHVSIVARCEGKTKEEVLQRITEDTIACHSRLRNILINHKEASEILDQLFEGYVSFHASLGRYRLEELL